MNKSRIASILGEINVFLKLNKSYEITKADYNMCVKVLSKINERYSVKDKNSKIQKTLNKKAKNKTGLNKRKKKIEGIGKEKYGTGFQKGKIEGDIDGSKGYHNIRENGRFGSHSMYDNMDDESMP